MKKATLCILLIVLFNQGSNAQDWANLKRFQKKKYGIRLF